LIDVKPLGIVNSTELSAWRKYYRRRDYRARKRAHSYLVDTGNGLDARLPKHALEIQHVEHTHPISALFFVTFFEKIVNLSGTLTRVPPQSGQKMGRDRLIVLQELLPNLFYR
jgi:hypothetical protein